MHRDEIKNKNNSTGAGLPTTLPCRLWRAQRKHKTERRLRLAATVRSMYNNPTARCHESILMKVENQNSQTKTLESGQRGKSARIRCKKWEEQVMTKMPFWLPYGEGEGFPDGPEVPRHLTRADGNRFFFSLGKFVRSTIFIKNEKWPPKARFSLFMLWPLWLKYFSRVSRDFQNLVELVMFPI